LRHARVVLVVVLLGLCGSSAATAAAGTPEARMLGKINATRADSGLPPLRAARNLQRSAGAFARWLITHDQFQHRPRVSVTRSYPHCGEALAMHFSLAADVGGTLRNWLGSPSHRALVMTNSMNLVGLGHASGRAQGRPRTIWVLQVARKR
jgi:uncharacterized protein YkwD